MTNKVSLQNIKLTTCTVKELEIVKKYIIEFQLDNRNLNFQLFTLVKYFEKIIGFARIVNHSSCTEICTLGVDEAYRNQGIAKFLIHHICKTITNPIYVVTIEPHIFRSSHFKIVTDMPHDLIAKLNYCTNELPVPQQYVAMMYIG